MENNDKATAIKRMEEVLSELKDKKGNMYFCVIDTKGTPSSYLEYLYRLAYRVKQMGFNVGMLHYEDEFIGVGNWLGEEFAELPHYNVNKKNVTVGPSDFVFIPEMYVSVMTKLKDIPAKKVVIIQDFKYLTEFLPIGVTFESLRIRDAIVTSDQLAKTVRGFFPNLVTHTITPEISNDFCPSDKPQKMSVNIISKEQGNVNRIVKPFYWKYSQFQWVSFADCRSMKQSAFAQTLKESAIAVWMDDLTPYGTALLEALRSGTVVLAKIPEVVPEWALDEKGNISEHILWFNSIDEVPDLIAGTANSWINNKVPADVYKEQASFNHVGNSETFYNEVKFVMREQIYDKRIREFEETIAYARQN